MPIVSVIIPSYNAMNYITETLESVLAQTLADIEIIVVDDGSNDNTREIVKEYAHKDSRLTLVEQTNQFAGVARNNGMARATGSYLYFLDADDYIEKNTLETLVSALEQSGADIAIAKSEGFDNVTDDTWTIDDALNGMDFNRPILHEEYCDRLFQSFIGWPWDKLFRKDFIEKTGLAFQPLRTTNDALFVFCALALADTIVCLDSVLFHHRTNNKDSLEGSRAKSWDNAVNAISSIGDLLGETKKGKACLNSYYRWILNYSIWTIESLPDGEANAYLSEIEPLINAMPQSADSFFDPYERNLKELLNSNRAKLISNAVAMLKERDAVVCDRANLEQTLDMERQRLNASEKQLYDVYESHSFKARKRLAQTLEQG